jgi:hypothetical protein
MKQISIFLDENTERELISRVGETASTLEEVASQTLAVASRNLANVAECNCGGLEFAANNPSIPVEFDAETHEYQIVKITDSYQTRVPIRFCFCCGGRAPASKREQLFEFIPASETTRLAQLFKGIHRLEDAIKLFGPPDQDIPKGMIRTDFGEDNNESVVYRSVVYSRLSDIADVRLTEQSNGNVMLSVTGKPKNL